MALQCVGAVPPWALLTGPTASHPGQNASDTWEKQRGWLLPPGRDPPTLPALLAPAGVRLCPSPRPLLSTTAPSSGVGTPACSRRRHLLLLPACQLLPVLCTPLSPLRGPSPDGGPRAELPRHMDALGREGSSSMGPRCPDPCWPRVEPPALASSVPKWGSCPCPGCRLRWVLSTLLQHICLLGPGEQGLGDPQTVPKEPARLPSVPMPRATSPPP